MFGFLRRKKSSPGPDERHKLPKKKIKGRPMKYPYTHTAKMVQFPFRFYFNNSWTFRYYIIAIFASLPIFYKIQKMSYSPQNVETWNEIRRKMYEGEE